jgi:4-alpha-glucanotransferase
MSINKRSNGILMHVSSLPSDYGIGKLGKEAFKFIDFLKRSGVKYWQILPLSQTSYGDSPYQSFSVHAGNPYFIDFDLLEEKGLLRKSNYNSVNWGTNPRHVDYYKIYQNCFAVLRIAHSKFKENPDPEYDIYKAENMHWLDDYALFMALKDANGGKAWYEWDRKLVRLDPEEIKTQRLKLADNIDFYCFLQYIFSMQWARVKSYANNQGISIIGDLPIYVSYDSVDVWVHPELFQLDKSKTPVAVAGCPPDSFSPTGQLWGNPIYNWQQHEKTNYKWWRDRFKTAKKLYDVIRIDHFRGFEGYYAIPYESVTAEIGEWFRGPGINFFNALEDDLKDVEIIAEDLGFITEDVREMLEKTGFPGMKVLQFAFDTDGKSEYLPHNFTTTNCVCYTGTHDNETLLGWVESASPETIRFVKKYFRLRNVKDIPEEIIRCTWGSVAVLAIAQIQDFLSAPASDRMNTPSTLGGNWEFRTLTSDFNARLSKHILDLNQIYNRI